MPDTISTGRARSLAELLALMGRMGGPDEFAASLAAWRPRATDVVISPYGKCGTTWLQQIFHTLRTRGDMAFDDISRVVPWIETSARLGIDIEAPQRAEPRGFKSHLRYDLLPRGSRAIVSLREPKDALVSMYRFMEGWLFEPGTITIAEYASFWMTGGLPGGDIWTHLLGWWEQRDNPQVLLLTYEHNLADPERAIRKVAAFCGIPLDDDLLALTLEHSSIGFMLQHKDRFDDLLMRQLLADRVGLPLDSDAAKVRQGKAGSHREELTAELAAAIDAQWTARVTPATGFADYAALDAAVRRRG